MLNQNQNGLHLSLPWPDRRLNPNSHIHWAKKDSARKIALQAGYYLARERGVTLDTWRTYELRLTFCPPNRRKYDQDNIIAALKPCFDGLARGLGIDDSQFRLKPDPEWGPVVQYGKIEATIVEIRDDQKPDTQDPA